MANRLTSPLTAYRRHILVQAQVVVSGWFSLAYGWGLEVESWPVLLTWGVLLSASLCPLLAWIMRGGINAR